MGVHTHHNHVRIPQLNWSTERGDLQDATGINDSFADLDDAKAHRVLELFRSGLSEKPR